MKKRHILIYLIPIIIILLSVILAIITSFKPDIGENTSYFCDVKVFTFKTDISVNKDDVKIASIKGKVIRFITDPLTMYDNNGTTIAYGGDEYHFINQDSHTIFINDQPTYEMVGNFNVFGDSYDIYDMNGILIANAEFNMLHSYGTIKGTDGTLWADYHSNFFRFDYDVRIKDECLIDDTSILMMMASFYSDKAADSRTN